MADMTRHVASWFWLFAVAFPLVLLFVVLVAHGWKGPSEDED
ncbi:MAG TPA: hypothetical protein VFJ58_28575 [Armatimonadota bacterium]|nr:hypothetical protein [Armatimonadota bacterium]